MCGIIGFSGLRDRALLSRMNRTHAHRGPDDSGEFWDPANSVGLAMRRLSVVDIAGGHQPMANEDGSVVVVYNGEIFNAADIRADLEQKGHTFATDHSDTEVILRLYEECGASAPAALNGMFAFVLYDKTRRILFGARDPFGIKPLYLHTHRDGMAWASELKSLHVLPTFSRDLDPVSVEQYLGLQYVPQERTIFSCARKLRPGHCFSYSLDTRDLSIRRYYDLPFQRTTSAVVSGTALEESLRHEFLGAVKRWSQSDVPIACSLSGGVDSAAVVACLARSTHKVRTYTLGYTSPADETINEREAARQVALLYGTDHHEIVLEVDDLIKALPDMVWHLDEPYGGGLPSWYVFKEIARDVKVAMTGVGGDELFSNYNKFRALELRPRFEFACRLQRQWPGVSRCASALSAAFVRARAPWPAAGDQATGVRAQHRRMDSPLFWTHPFGISYPTAHGRGFNERVFSRVSVGLSAGRQVLEDVSRTYGELGLRDRCVAVDFNTQLPDEFLHMTDRFSMAFSLEARTPFLDRDFVEAVLAMPAKNRLTPDQPKRLLKDSFNDWLPAGHTDLRKKGFVLPMARWLQGPLRRQAEDLFSETALRRGGWIRSDFKEAYFRPFLEGQPNLTETLWTVFMFRLWEEHGSR